MDNAKLILTGEVLPPVPLEHLSRIGLHNKIAKLESGKVCAMTEERKKQAAKDFESVFIKKLLDEMANAIGEWGFEKDGVSKQIQGLFSIYLSQHIANNDGFGLWKDVYRFMTELSQGKTTIETSG
jgi:Rod binding domain-containing protein